MADRFQSPTLPTTVATKKPEMKIVVQGAKLSDRMKMFGGGAAKTPHTAKSEEKKGKDMAGKTASYPMPTRAKKQNVTKPDGGSDSTDGGASTPPGTPTPPDTPGTSTPPSTPTPPTTPPRITSQKKRSSSYAGISAFETIEEEGSSGVEESTESLDKVAPLPKLGPSLSRRHSAELLRMDGIVKPDIEAQASKASAAHKAVEAESKASRSPASQSPLLASKKAASLHGAKDSKSDRRRDGSVATRSISVPAQASTQGSEAMALFMNSANLSHLNSLQDEHREKEKKRVAKAMGGLLSMPQWTGRNVQLKVMGLKTDDRPKIQIWKQHVSMDEVLVLMSLSSPIYCCHGEKNNRVRAQHLI